MIAAQQARMFAAMALCGLGVGALHDLLGVLRKGAASAAVADLLLGITAAAGVIAAALHLRCEAFRLYTFMGVLVGWAIYALTLGAIVRILTRKFIKLSKKLTN